MKVMVIKMANTNKRYEPEFKKEDGPAGIRRRTNHRNRQ